LVNIRGYRPKLALTSTLVLKAKSPMANHPILVLSSAWNKYSKYKTEKITVPDKTKYAIAWLGRCGAGWETDRRLRRMREPDKDRTIDETIRTIAEQRTPGRA